MENVSTEEKTGQRVHFHRCSEWKMGYTQKFDSVHIALSAFASNHPAQFYAVRRARPFLFYSMLPCIVIHSIFHESVLQQQAEEKTTTIALENECGQKWKGECRENSERDEDIWPHSSHVGSKEVLRFSFSLPRSARHYKIMFATGNIQSYL